MTAGEPSTEIARTATEWHHAASPISHKPTFFITTRAVLIPASRDLALRRTPKSRPSLSKSLALCPDQKIVPIKKGIRSETAPDLMLQGLRTGSQRKCCEEHS